MSFNGPHVNRLTRQWLRRNHLEALGEGMLGDMHKVLHHHRARSLCGLVYDAAQVFGVPVDAAVAVASASELLYCAFGLVDDIQDGDAYYLNATPAQQLNVALALRELGVIRAVEVIPAGPMLVATGDRMSRTVLEMTLSQREELAAKAQGYQPPWDIAAYERVARGAAGAEVALFLFLVGVVVDLTGAAGVRDDLMSETLARIGYLCGVALQIAVDSATDDERVTVLPGPAVDGLRRRQEELFRKEADAIPPELVALLAGVARFEV
jgi:hypothetical protein